MFKVRSAVAVGATALMALTASALAPVTGATASPVPTAAPNCAAFNDPVSLVVKPTNNASIVTPWAAEATAAAKYGFTQNQGVLFKASTTAKAGLVPVNTLYRGGVVQDFLFSQDSGEVESAGRLFKYTSQGVAFYASATKADCLIPVVRYRKGSRHRLATEVTKAELVSAGWTSEGVSFYAAPASGSGTPTPPNPTPKPTPTPTPSPTPTPTKTTTAPTPTPTSTTTAPTPAGTFKFAVIPDTQKEVTRTTDPRFKNRNEWLVKQGVKFAVQTGDLLNWDTPDHAQARLAKEGFDVLHNAGIPYTFAIGNHDTQATGVGGAARDATRTYQLQRDTSTVNSFFKTSDFGSVGGAYESGKIDNVYTLYNAGGLKWMVLTMEFCARPGAVTWAKKVVADHPDYNVMISTHSYENGGGGLDTSNQGYGDTSGKQLFDQLASQYPNVKMVFSGHVGIAAKARVDTGVKGNKIYSFLTTMHDDRSNPVRIIEVDPNAGTMKTSIYGPYTDYTWSAYSETISDVKFVR